MGSLHPGICKEIWGDAGILTLLKLFYTFLNNIIARVLNNKYSSYHSIINQLIINYD